MLVHSTEMTQMKISEIKLVSSSCTGVQYRFPATLDDIAVLIKSVLKTNEPLYAI